MSGIVGVFHRDGAPSRRDELAPMLAAIAHRGPDGIHQVVDEPVGLGHAMLYTTPASLHERLPLEDRTGRYTITADARVDNRDDLARRLGWPAKGPVLTPEIPDSHLILAAYARWQEQALDHIIGDFTFAIWDRVERRLVLARDHLGIRSLYVHATRDLLVWGTEIKAVLAHPQVPREVNEAQLARYLIDDFSHPTETAYRGIERVPPGTYLIVETDRLRQQTYWEAAIPEDDPALTTPEDYVAAFREHLMEAVRCRLRSAYPVGAQLSGGLDSSTIAVAARHVLRQADPAATLRTYSTVFEQVPRSDERPYIEAVLAQGGFIPQFIAGDQPGFYAWQDTLWTYEDEPLVNANYYLTYAINEQARADGTRILLGGFDGDTVVGYGFERFVEAARQGNWEAFVSNADAIAARRQWDRQRARAFYFERHGANYLEDLIRRGSWLRWWREVNAVAREAGFSRRALATRYGRAPLLRRLAPWRDRSSSEEADNGSELLLEEIRKRYGISEKRTPVLPKADFSARDIRDLHLHKYRNPFFPIGLEGIERAYAAFGLEARHPFLDVRLVEFCLSVPPACKLRDGWTRWILRAAFRDLLPPAVAERPQKTSLVPNFVFQVQHAEKTAFDQSTGPALSNDIGDWIQPGPVRDACERIRQGAPGGRDIGRVSRVLLVAGWRRQQHAARSAEAGEQVAS